MKRKLKYLFLTSLIISGAVFSSAAQEERRHVRNGIEYLSNENYPKAEEAFRQALREKPSSFEAGYNLATALFRQERFEEAVEQLQAIEPYAENQEQEAKLYHNLGNSYLFNQKIDESIEAYKESLKRNPLDDETRYNLIAAMKLKDEQEDQEDEQEDEDEQQEEQEQEQEQQEQQQDEQEQEQEQQEQQHQEGISEEAAERLLQGVEQDELEILEKMDRHKEEQPVRIEKNW